MDESLKLQFEQIFTSHYERLTNSRQSVGGLPFTLENIVCFILFGGRELDIEDIYGDVSERYSMETFMADAREAGIEASELLYKAISDMVAQKFLHLQPDNHFYSYQATRETARMLNRIYPKMKGINMLAYIGQTIQEVESGRIDREAALSRFDQTLNKQGAPLPKPKIPTITPPPKAPVLPKKSEENKAGSSKIIRDYVVSSAGVMAKIDKAAVPNQVLPENNEQAPPETAKPEESPEPITVGQESMREAETTPDKPPIAEIQEAPPAEAESRIVDDDEIAAKIAAFEQELALVCPICKTSVLKEKTTAAGKNFYSCTSEKCNFISWGRPHQVPCARCKNSFMVEAEDSTGKIILKCPRATCQHRQPLAPAAPPAGVAKKVIRKRLVRRKV